MEQLLLRLRQLEPYVTSSHYVWLFSHQVIAQYHLAQRDLPAARQIFEQSLEVGPDPQRNISMQQTTIG